MVKWPKTGKMSDMVSFYRKHKEVFNLPDEVTFEGKVKLHGTNASIRQDKNGLITCQSRNRVLSLDKDNAGFCAFVNSLISNDESLNWLNTIFNLLKSDTGKDDVTIFGEWCGGNIAAGVGLNNFDKHFVIFGMIAGDQPATILPIHIDNKDEGIYNIFAVEPVYLTVDMEDPENLQFFSEEIEKVTLQYEDSCPWTEYLYSLNKDSMEEPECKTGEGLVWDCVDFIHDQMRFKSKGDKHSGNKRNKFKKIAPVDVEVLKSIDEFVEYALTESRLNQGLENVEGLENRFIGDYIRWIANDIIKEESKELGASGLEWKQVAKNVTKKSKEFFIKKIEKL